MDLLPDSRLKDANLGTVMVDWPLPSGERVRIEVSPIYCVGCGAHWGYVPRENTVQATYICNDCFRKDPNVFNGLVASDEQFCQDVGFEMQERFGRTLTETELVVAAQDNTLGAALELLARESPYPTRDHRPKG